jgi:hypothetical protein
VSSSAPVILSPWKITVKSSPKGASLRFAPGQTLDSDLPRQELGAYQEDEGK